MNKLKGLESLHVKSFRGIKSLELNSFSDINILVGENNKGKTSVLEAIQLISNPFSQLEFSFLSRQREKAFLRMRYLTGEEAIRWLFTKESTGEVTPINIEYIYNSNIESINCTLREKEYYIISSSAKKEDLIEDFFNEDLIETITEQTVHVTKYDQNQKFLNEIEYIFDSQNEPRRESKGDKLFHCSYISAVDHRLMPISVGLLNKLIQEGKRDQLLETLRYFDPDIKGIELLVNKSRRTGPYIDHLKLGIVPISAFGDGLRKALLVSSKVIDSEDGVLLIDEIETGIHTHLIPDYIKWISELCETYHVKLFATSHSLETVDGILNANIDQLDKVSFYRLYKKGEQTKARYFSGEKLKDIRYELGQDVR